ncbi:HAMP domain-containing sensor histidine kinase [Cohnella sp. 56]|uniref:HAMP domain-containing sensor histidine kinase n=1 Tax=Cohnella sp. 56 TaxID=3113722 RepID=UPI0030E8A78D
MSVKRGPGRAVSVSTVPLLRHWTWRYTLLLLILLIGIGIIGIGWIRDNAIKQQFEVLNARAELLASYYAKSIDEQLAEDISPGKTIRSMPMMPAIPEQLYVLVYEFEKGVLRPEGRPGPPELERVPPSSATDTAERTREVISTKRGKWLRVGIPYMHEGQYAGKYYASMRLDNGFERTYILILAAIGLIALLGWMIVYMLSRSLTRPLRGLALAAGRISDGDYQPELPDATRIKEAEIAQLVHSFVVMSDRLEQLERMRIDLLASVSHELRTPVTSIRGMIQAVKDGVVTGAGADEFMELCMIEAKRLQTMVNELLDFSAMETDTIRPTKEAFELDELIGEVVAQLRTLPLYEGIELLVADRPRIVWAGDRMHLKQMLLNLMNNGAAAGAGRIAIEIQHDDAFVRIDVADDGRGIPAEEEPFIFERYYRGDNRRKKKHGLGLGLPLCQLLAQANGGNVRLLQTSPSGTVFRITLPVQ